LTYGEACIEEQFSMRMVNGEAVPSIEHKNKPKRMKREDAAKYYNKKLFDYWINQLDDNLSELRKKQIISLFMFGHTDRHKLFKGK